MKKVRLNTRIEESCFEYCLDGEACHHLIHVLKARPGEKIEGIDQDGKIFHFTLQNRENTWIAGDLKICLRNTEPPYDVHLVQALPRGEKLDWVLQKSVELGATHIHLLKTKYTQVEIEERKREQKQNRWKKIISSAALQAGRGRIPELFYHPSLPNLLQELPEFWNGRQESPLGQFEVKTEVQVQKDLAFVAYEKEKEEGFHSWIDLWKASRLSEQQLPDKIYFFVGPEGGWAEEEISLLNQNQVHSLHLGSRILRTETAGIALLSALAYEFEWF